MVFALNRVKPRYVTQRRGAVLARVRMERDQEVADLSVALVEGFRRVHESPRRDHNRPAGRPGG
jgi:hypothetical protein